MDEEQHWVLASPLVTRLHSDGVDLFDIRLKLELLAQAQQN